MSEHQKPTTQAYRDGYDRIFGKKPKPALTEADIKLALERGRKDYEEAEQLMRRVFSVPLGVRFG